MGERVHKVNGLTVQQEWIRIQARNLRIPRFGQTRQLNFLVTIQHGSLLLLDPLVCCERIATLGGSGGCTGIPPVLFQMRFERGQPPYTVKPGIGIGYVESKIVFTSTNNPERDT
jgi:hypothetical protein